MIRPDAAAAAAIVLASASPRRRDLLALLAISFTIQVADVDETPHDGEVPVTLTRRLARAKALAVSVTQGTVPCQTTLLHSTRQDMHITCDDAGAAGRPGIVLAADTIVVLGDTILNKPRNDDEAVAMLAALRGRAHRVMTGIAFALHGDVVWDAVTETTVWMRAYGDDEVERYLQSGKHRDKAGAYGIQDADFHPVERIEGCLANVVGLPLCEVRAALLAIDPARFQAAAWAPADDSATNRHDVCDRALDI